MEIENINKNKISDIERRTKRIRKIFDRIIYFKEIFIENISIIELK